MGSPSFMSFLTANSPGSVSSTTKRNPHAATQTGATPTPGNSPVTATGTINPATPPRPQYSPSMLAANRAVDNGTRSAGGSGGSAAPTQAQLAAFRDQGPATAAQTTLPGAPGPGWFRGPDGGWLPPDRATGPNAAAGGGAAGAPATVPGLSTPAYAQHLAGQTAYGGTNLGQHQNITYDPTEMTLNMPSMYGPYQQWTPQTQLPAQGYTAGNFGTTPFSQYNGNPGNISQFTGPQQQQVAAQQQQLLMQMLQNPLSMSDQNVSQLKAQQRATALAAQQAGMSQNAEMAAAQGRVGGSAQLAGDARMQNTALDQILSGYRDIDLKKMTQDNADRYKAIEGATGVMDSASQRATSEFAQQLAGQQAREKVGLDSATSAQAAERLGLDRTSAQELARMNEATSGQALARLGLDQDSQRQKENQFAFGTQQQAFTDQLAALQKQMDATTFNAGENRFATESAQTNQQQALQRAIAQAADSQASSASGLNLAGMLQDSWNNQANRDMQTSLAQQGFGIDNSRIASNERLGKMSNSTQLLDILLGDQRGRMGLGLQGQQIGNQASQFNQTFGLQQQDQQNRLMQWLFGNL